MTQKHTPAPWQVCMTIAPRDDVMGQLSIESVHHRGNYLANIDYRIGDMQSWQPHEKHRHLRQEEARANANLIAAAPELLEALKDMVSAVEINAPKNDRILTLEFLRRARAAIAKAEGK